MLLTSFAIKLGFIVVELAMAIAFGVTEYLDINGYNTSAILEWIVALIYIFCTCRSLPPPSHRIYLSNLTDMLVLLQMCGHMPSIFCLSTTLGLGAVECRKQSSIAAVKK